MVERGQRAGFGRAFEVRTVMRRLACGTLTATNRCSSRRSPCKQRRTPLSKPGGDSIPIHLRGDCSGAVRRLAGVGTGNRPGAGYSLGDSGRMMHNGRLRISLSRGHMLTRICGVFGIGVVAGCCVLQDRRTCRGAAAGACTCPVQKNFAGGVTWRCAPERSSWDVALCSSSSSRNRCSSVEVAKVSRTAGDAML